MCVYRLVGSRRRGATRIEINRASPLLPFARGSPRRIVDRRTEPLPGRKFISRGPDPPNSPRFEPTNYFLVAQVSRRGCKPQPPLEIAGIRAAVPLTFELHEYSRPNDHREGPFIHSLVYTRFRAFFAVFFPLPPPRIASISATGSPWDQSWNFQSSMVRASEIKLTRGSRTGEQEVWIPSSILLAIFISTPFIPFPFISSLLFNRRSNFLHDFSNFSKHACRNDQSKRERSRDFARGRMEIGDDTRSRFNYHVPLDGRVIISAVRVGRGEEKEGNIRSPG